MKASTSKINTHALGSGAPVVSVSMYFVIIRYRMPMPPMTTRLTITVQKAPFFVFFTPWSVRA